MKKQLSFITYSLFLLFVSITINAQERPLTGDDILKWNKITEQRISNDGKYVVYKTQPWKGDPTLYITDSKSNELMKIDCGTRSVITENSKYVVFTIQPKSKELRALKLKKTKKDKMPMATLGVYNLETSEIDTFPRMKSFQLPAKWTCLAYQLDRKSEKEKEKEKEKEESDKNGRELLVLDFETMETTSYPFVTNYQFAAEKEVLIFVSTGDEKEFTAGLYHVDILSGKLTHIHKGPADYKQLTVTKNGSKGAFLADVRDEKERKKKSKYSLFSWNGSNTALEIVDESTSGLPENWEVRKNGRLSFSDSGQRLFMGLSPIPAEKDTTILDEEKPVLDIWHWNEPVLQTVQLKNKSRDSKKTYTAVYHFDSSKLVLLQTKDLSSISLIKTGDADKVVALSNLPYAVQSMWEGSPSHNDIYLIDIKSGEKELIKKDIRIRPSVSPNGTFLYWHNSIDTTWNSYEIATGKEYELTNAQSIQTANELNDVPNPPRAYGEAGWLKDDKALIIYDRHNIWLLDPRNSVRPKNLTKANPEDGIAYRIIDFDRTESRQKGIDSDKIKLLKGHNEITREDGYFSWSLSKSIGHKAGGIRPKAILYGSYKLSTPLKAKNEDVVVFTKEDFQIFPNLLSSKLKFKNIVQISDANPQQKEFLWGTAELVSWTSLDGRKLEGTLHKPQDFDPNKKYPMIVNFYEKSSQGLFGHHIPERGRSTIDYHYYTSQGYLIFNPDVYYKEGYPGEDAFNCVMPGITALIQKGFVDEKAIGAQGHSWGGYQVAYLATRTNLFAAIESGAPVVNMFSAYGGIRWGSGKNRSFQYEHTQSRIGKSIWESPLRYIENSPLFTMDKVQTPILIMHNDDDGAVPWYQGIEYFIALRRLGKPAWLLNYNNADHWPTRLEDKHDFQIRLAQFFDHYLKGEPMPEWMEKGVPAVDKGINLGY
ncbi:MAG: S9 family peptidase [Bacteroidales bacterium]|nr:S9 family peptidase [Bacteroidales bacterium]